MNDGALHLFAGDLQDTLAAMWERANEAIVALSSFSHVSKGHTALTTECGSMLEEVLELLDVKNIMNLEVYFLQEKMIISLYEHASSS